MKRIVRSGNVYTNSEDQLVILCTVNGICSVYNSECKPISLYKLSGKILMLHKLLRSSLCKFFHPLGHRSSSDVLILSILLEILESA